MQDQSNENVISLFKKSTSSKLQAPTPSSPTSSSTLSSADGSSDQTFAETMRKNAENQKRLREDRLKANKSVLRSYRIKK